MHLNAITKNTSYMSKPLIQCHSNSQNLKNYKPDSNYISLFNTDSSFVRANYIPANISFTGNAPRIKNACIITGEEQDLPLLITKQNDSYVVEFDTQTEIIYGLDAIKYLNKKSNYEYDTQVIIPKHSEGILQTEGKNIPLKENSGVIINSGTDAKINITKGYPMVIVSKKDFDWYERYGRNPKDINIRNKFLELMYYNAHLYNGDYTPNVLLPARMCDENFLKTLSIDKWASRNKLVYDIYAKRDMLNETDRAEIEFIKTLIDKLYAKQLIKSQDDGYVRFSNLYNEEYQRKVFAECGLEDSEIDKIMPSYKKARQINIDSKFSRKNTADGLSPEIIDKMKSSGILHKNKKLADKYIYWCECYGNEQSLRTRLAKEGFSPEEQNVIVKKWLNSNNTGFDISGLKFLNDNIAVYNLNDKLNNWTHETTNWLTNSTAAASSGGKTPFVGISLVQTDKEEAVSIDEIRSGEKLHTHPNLEEKRQTEIYMVTSGAAALNVVKNGKSQVKILKEGELAVVGPGVEHCVNSVIGEYEHIVAQIPSAFQYGLDFKTIVTPPADYNETALRKEAYKELSLTKNA